MSRDPLERHRPRTVPYGFCQCGCGEKTNLAPYTDRSKGWLRGEPLKYILGHTQRKSPIPYVVDRETGCWVWQRSRSAAGYGRIKPRGHKQLMAHRWYYEQHVGPIPEGLQLDHLCRNRACVNPDHLEPVTQAENIRRGLPFRDRKLSVEQVAEILSSPESGLGIARRLGISQSYVSAIRCGTQGGCPAWMREQAQALLQERAA